MYKEPESTRKKLNVDLSLKLPARVEILARDTPSSCPLLVTCTDGIGGLRGRKELLLFAANNSMSLRVYVFVTIVNKIAKIVT